MELSWVAIGVGFAINFVVGGVWYGVFANAWMREVGLSEAEIKAGGFPMPSYAVAAAGAALQALVFGWIHGWTGGDSVGQTMLLGLAMGLAAAFATGKHHAFSKKTWTLFAIDGGSDLAGFVGMAGVFAWLG